MENLSPNPNKAVQPNYHRTETKLHRFVPTEKPRAVTEHPQTPATKIAGTVGFKPVATLQLPNKSVFVRPVKNTHPRAVSPAVVNPDGKLQVSKGKTIEISGGLHSQIKAQVTSTLKTIVPPKSAVSTPQDQKYVNSADLHPAPKPAPKVEPTSVAENKVQTQSRNENLKKQLDTLNKVLFDQIKQKISAEITRQSPPQTQPTQAPKVAPRPLAENSSKVQPQPRTEQSMQEKAKTSVGPSSPISREHLRTLIETKPDVEKLETLPIKPIIQPLAQAQPVHKQVLASQPISPPLPRKQSPAEPHTAEQYKQHIGKLEEEIGLLNKEVNYMDRTIADLEKERDQHELTSLEKKIEVDRAMLKAVADWRLALNNLINSHTVALKYLKQKTDWLESQVEKISGHKAKHSAEHRRPKPLEIKMGQVSPTTPPEVRITGVGTEETAKPLSSEVVLGSKLAVSSVEQATTKPPSGPLDVNANLNIASVTEVPKTKPTDSPLTIQANLVTKEVSADEASKTDRPTVVKEVQTTSFEAVKTLVQEALKKEQPNISPSEAAVKTLVDKTLESKELVGKTSAEDIQKVVAETVKSQGELVKEAVQKEVANIKPSDEVLKSMVEKTLEETPLTAKATEASVKEALSQTLKTEPRLVKPSVEEIKSIIKEELKEQKAPTTPEPKAAAPTKEELKTLVKEIISEGGAGAKPTEVTVNLTKEAPQTSVSTPTPTGGTPTVAVNLDQADIEKQILDAASKEDSEREAREEARREEARKKAEALALKKLEEVKAKEPKPIQNTQTSVATSPQTPQEAVSAENLQGTFAKLKADLTTIDSQTLGNLSTDQRTQMIQKLQNLEKDAEVSRQYDELKAAAERRRINAELQNMLGGARTKTPEPIPAPPQATEQKIETLKLVEKKQQTPEEKAKVIAEIKDLERQAQARKAAEAARPTVKAQPAYGKMLPNTPTTPNVINGIVKDTKGLLLPTVVIIVKDQTGEPVRALKTNKIGQFALSTAVPNGTYTLELEKEGYDFDIIEVDVNGTIMQPIEVKSK